MQIEFARVTDQAVWDVQAHPTLGRIVVVLAAAVEIWNPDGTQWKRIAIAADFGCFDGAFAYLKQRSDGALLRVSLDSDAEPASAKPVGRLLTRVFRSRYGLVGGDWDGALHLWDAESLVILRTTPLPGDGPARVAVLPDGERVVVHGGSAGAHVVRISDGHIERTFHPRDRHDTVLVDVHRRHVLTYGDPSRTECWDVDTGTRIWRLQARSEGSFGELLWDCFVYGSNTGVFRVDLASGVAQARIATAGQTPALLLQLADGRGFAISSDRTSVSSWTAQGSSSTAPGGHQGAIRHAAVHPAQPIAYTWGGDSDRSVRVWRC